MYMTYDCAWLYLELRGCIYSFPFPVHKAKLPTLGMLMLDQKTSKKELGGFDHPGQAQRQIFNMFKKMGRWNGLLWFWWWWIDVHLAVESDYHWVMMFIWQAVSAISWNRKWWKDWRWRFVILANWHLSWRNPSPAAFLPWKYLGPNVMFGRGVELGFVEHVDWGSRSFGDLWRHGFHDVVPILGTEKHQVTSDS